MAAEPRLLRIRWDDGLGPLLRSEILDLFRRVREDLVRHPSRVQAFEVGRMLRDLTSKLPFATETGDEPDLRGLQLDPTDMLYGLNLSNVRMDYMRLGKAGVQLCNLSFAHLTGINAEGLRLSGTFEYTVFRAAQLNHANLSYQTLYGCDFMVANLRQANLKSCNIRRCKFGQAQAQHINLADTVVEDCDFRGADLSYSLWQNAVIGAGVLLEGTNLHHAVLDPSMRQLAVEQGAVL